MSRTDAGLRVADVYAQALYELAAQDKAVEGVKDELEMLDTVIAQETGFLNIMASPQFASDYKYNLLRSMFAGRLSDLTLNFLLTANKHNRMMFLPHILARFVEIWDAHHGISAVELTVCENLSEEELRSVSQAITNAMKKQVKIKLNVSPSIMGGAIIRYGDRIIDNSVKTRLHLAVNTIMARCQGQG